MATVWGNSSGTSFNHGLNIASTLYSAAVNHNYASALLGVGGNSGWRSSGYYIGNGLGASPVLPSNLTANQIQMPSGFGDTFNIDVEIRY